MHRTYFLSLAIIIALNCACCKKVNRDGKRVDTLSAAALHPLGRTLLTRNSIELIGSASHVGFAFTGLECQLLLSLRNREAHNYIQYELDGLYQGRVRINGNDEKPLAIRAKSDGPHTVWIYKATEAHSGPIFIEGIAGTELKGLAPPDRPLIEFIGNSITCGAAADPSETACGAGVYHDQHNAYDAYGPRVARALGANFMLSSVSGIGIYRNWNTDGPTMPQVYEKADFIFEGTRLWNFATYRPKVVSIALGTNDFSNGDGKRERQPFDSAVFVDNYIEFVGVVKSKYPETTIVLLSSPMISSERRAKLQNCLTAVKTQVDEQFPNDEPVAIYFFKPMIARGCTGHPNVEDHAILAREVAPFFKELLR